MSDHYRLSDETLTLPSGEVLRRVIATRDLPQHGVRAGDVGGWLGPDAYLGENAWIADDAKVFGRARVRDNSLICDNAQVCNNTQVWGNSRICDYAMVCGGARTQDGTRVGGDARVGGNALLSREADVSRSDHILTIGPVGSEGVTVTLARARSGHVLRVGCWAGTVDELPAGVEWRTRFWDADDATQERWRAEYAAIEILCRARIAGW